MKHVIELWGLKASVSISNQDPNSVVFLKSQIELAVAVKVVHQHRDYRCPCWRCNRRLKGAIAVAQQHNEILRGAEARQIQDAIAIEVRSDREVQSGRGKGLLRLEGAISIAKQDIE